jgi:hypothetical protein
VREISLRNRPLGADRPTAASEISSHHRSVGVDPSTLSAVGAYGRAINVRGGGSGCQGGGHVSG